MSRALTKQTRLETLKRMMLERGDQGISVEEAATLLKVDYSTAWRYITQLGAKQSKWGTWVYDSTQADLDLARAIITNSFFEPQGRKCPNCGKRFDGEERQVYCSEKCKKSAANRRNYQRRKQR